MKIHLVCIGSHYRGSYLFCVSSLYTCRSSWCPYISLLVLLNHFSRQRWYAMILIWPWRFLLSLSCFPLHFLCVCQIGFMYLICLGEQGTVETKALRHILLARTSLKKTPKQIHTCSFWIHTYTCKSRHKFFQVLEKFCVAELVQCPHFWFFSLVAPKIVCKELSKSYFIFILSKITSYNFDTSLWLWRGFFKS